MKAYQRMNAYYSQTQTDTDIHGHPKISTDNHLQTQIQTQMQTRLYKKGKQSGHLGGGCGNSVRIEDNNATEEVDRNTVSQEVDHQDTRATKKHT